MPLRKKGTKPTRPTNLKAREREYEALELRKAGATYQQIGARLGISKQAAHDRVKSALAELKTLTNEEAEDVRRLDLERIDAMLLGLWPKARAGDVKAVMAVTKLMERRASYLGLDAPKQHELGGVGGGAIQTAKIIYYHPDKDDLESE